MKEKHPFGINPTEIQIKSEQFMKEAEKRPYLNYFSSTPEEHPNVIKERLSVVNLIQRGVWSMEMELAFLCLVGCIDPKDCYEEGKVNLDVMRYLRSLIWDEKHDNFLIPFAIINRALSSKLLKYNNTKLHIVIEVVNITINEEKIPEFIQKEISSLKASIKEGILEEILKISNGEPSTEFVKAPFSLN